MKYLIMLLMIPLFVACGGKDKSEPETWSDIASEEQFNGTFKFVEVSEDGKMVDGFAQANALGVAGYVIIKNKKMTWILVNPFESAYIHTVRNLVADEVTYLSCQSNIEKTVGDTDNSIGEFSIYKISNKGRIKLEGNEGATIILAPVSEDEVTKQVSGLSRKCEDDTDYN